MSLVVVFRTVNTILMESTAKCVCLDTTETPLEEPRTIARLTNRHEKKRADHAVTADVAKSSLLSLNRNERKRVDHVEAEVNELRRAERVVK